VAESNWIEILSAIGSIATPILVLGLTAVGWKYRQTIERQMRLEEKLRDHRIVVYNQILEPFILILMTEEAWQSDKKNRHKDKNEIATTQMLSLEYRQASSKLSLMGSDEVVSAFNDLMQYFFNQDYSADSEVSEEKLNYMMRMLGKFLLEIRKSMGNEKTTLDHWSMLEWFLTDARKMRANEN